MTAPPHFLNQPDRSFAPRRVGRIFARALLVAAVAVGGPLALGPETMTSPAWAQNSNLKTLLDRVDRLQRELATLQRQVYRGEPPPSSAGQSAGAVELSGTQAARLEVRMSQFEQQLRGLTGQLEEQSFRINRLSQQLDALTADFDRRLQPPAAEAQGTAGATPTTGGSAALDSAPGSIGSISPEELAAMQSQADTSAAQQAALGTDDSPQGQYDRAFSLLSQTQYEEAGQAFNAFLQKHPNHRLAGNAKYWLGETYYVQGQYTEAAVTFAEGFQDYPESAKAPDNLLKLGKSLAALDQTEDACGTFAELIKRYTAAPPTILQQAKTEQKRLGCP